MSHLIPTLHTRRDNIDEAVYSTSVPLVVAERIRQTTTYDDGTRVDRSGILATWYALRWLMTTFPEFDGFNQRQIAAIAAIDQKSVYKRLRLLYQLNLIAECGERCYTNLIGQDGQAKTQRLYTIPLRELHRLSSTEAPHIVEQWRKRLFGDASPPAASISPDKQLPIDLTDNYAVCIDQNQRDVEPNRRDTLPHPSPPSPPLGQPNLIEHPHVFLARTFGTNYHQIDLFVQLANDYDIHTNGYGWYWLGRAIFAATLSAGGEDQVRNWIALVRTILRNWHDTASYGAEAPRRTQRHHSPLTPASLAPVSSVVSEPPHSDLSEDWLSPRIISLASHITPKDRVCWEDKLRRAESPLQEQEIVRQFLEAHPAPESTPDPCAQTVPAQAVGCQDHACT